MCTHGKLLTVFIWSSLLYKDATNTHTDQTILRVYYETSQKLNLRKENVSKTKPLQVTAAKQFLPSVYVTGTACFDQCFLFYVRTGRLCFLYIN